jgi:hypothetical protein
MHCPSSLCQASTNHLTVKLAREDGERELNGADVSKRDLDHAARSLWQAVNGNPGEALYAGEFDQ